MKHVTPWRDPERARRLADRIATAVTRPWRIMEVCGGQTHAIVRFGLDEVLPDEITLIHGPGCPVCVTPLEIIDQALAIAAQPDVIFCSFGDMLRVPVNVVDHPEDGSFIMPSIIDRSPVVAAVSTGGASPVLARLIRSRLESVIPAGYGRLAELCGRFREPASTDLQSGFSHWKYWMFL